MKKILIISYDYPPFNNIAARRFSEMAPFFASNGWVPYFLTTNSVGDLESNIDDDNIFRIGQHSGLKLDAQYRKSFKNKISDIRRSLGFCFRVFDTALFGWSGAVLSNDKIISELKSKRFDMILSSYGPSSALRLGSKLSNILNVPLVFDFRDLGALHQGDSYNQNFIAKFIDRNLERKYLKKSKVLTTVSNGLADELRLKYRQDVHVFYNGWVELDKKNNQSIVLENKEPYIYYAGRFYEHRIESVFMLIEQLKDTEYRLVVRSLGPKALEAKILDFACLKGVENKVIILPPVSAEEVELEQNLASINLVVEDLSKKHRASKGVLTGKFLQLLTLKGSVLAIARDDSEIGEVLEETEKGMLVSSVTDLKKFFLNLKLDDNLYLGNKQIGKYSKEKQTSELCFLLKTLL